MFLYYIVCFLYFPLYCLCYLVLWPQRWINSTTNRHLMSVQRTKHLLISTVRRTETRNRKQRRVVAKPAAYLNVPNLEFYALQYNPLYRSGGKRIRHAIVNLYCSVPNFTFLHHVALRDETPQTWSGLEYRVPRLCIFFTDHGEIWHARVNLQCALSHQVSYWLVHPICSVCRFNWFLSPINITVPFSSRLGTKLTA